MASLINQPVYINGKQGRYLGVCRFYGTTGFKDGVWVGVELDRPIGKNDGSVKGVRYFDCKPRHGLFARAETVEAAEQAPPPQQAQAQARRPPQAAAPPQPQQQQQQKRQQHFQIAASAFCFRKDTNQWSELGTGSVRLYLGSDSKIHLDSAGAQTALNHTVDMGTKLEPNVGSDRAWVFRATNTATYGGDVIALQFGDPMAAQSFADMFDDLTLGTEGMEASGAAPAPPAPSAPSAAAAPPAAPPAQQQSNLPMRQQRRRLSVVGGDNMNIDGRRSSAFDESADQPTFLRGHSGVAGTVIGEYSGMSKKGYAPYNGKKENQDVCFMHQDPATNSMLFATFDGHGQFGHLVSRYFQKHLCASVVKHPSWVTDPARAMRDCMLQREKELNQGRAVDTQLSGTTAVFALVRGDQLTVLNAGDSRLILGVRDSVTGRVVPKEITHDNKPDNPLEQARIEANGGRVWAMKYDDGIDGPARVWLKDQNIPGLAMSRSLCDEVAKRAGVISEPEIYHEHLGSDVVYLCMATDGLWEFLSNEQVVEMINQFGQEPQAAIDLMMKKSEALWRKNEEVVDDTSIILAYLHDIGK